MVTHGLFDDAVEAVAFLELERKPLNARRAMARGMEVTDVKKALAEKRGATELEDDAEAAGGRHSMTPARQRSRQVMWRTGRPS
eukprot:9905705-Lingulodinium_polyedra.AAC.1